MSGSALRTLWISKLRNVRVWRGLVGSYLTGEERRRDGLNSRPCDKYLRGARDDWEMLADGLREVVLVQSS